jgi:hypothetical protein
MGHVFFRGGRLCAAVLVSMILALAVVVGSAKATTPPSGTVSATQTTASFTGGPLVAPLFLPECPSQQDDPTNAVCEHYTLTVVGSGAVNTCVSFTQDMFGLNDVDVFIYQIDPTTGAQTLVAAGIGVSNPECVSFVQAGGMFEIRISPTFIVGPIFISGVVTFTPLPLGGGQGSNPPPMPVGTKMTGGGQDASGGTFNESVFATDLSKGKVKYVNNSLNCSFKSTQIKVVSLTTTPDGGIADVDGVGELNGVGGVTFHAHAEDHGEPGTTDRFQLTSPSQCTSGNPTLRSGNLQYHTT